MEKTTYRINARLINELVRVFMSKHIDMAATCHIAIATWHRIIKDPLRLTVQQLLALANGLHMPVSKFFSTGKTDVVGRVEDYVVYDGYQECRYDPDVLVEMIGSRTITWREAAKVVGIHHTNVKALLLAEHRLPVTSLIAICDRIELGLFEVLIDNNCKTLVKRKKEVPQPAGNTDTTQLMKQMQAEIGALKQLLAETQRELTQLREAHNILARRINVNIGTVQDSYLAIAAEPEVEYGVCDKTKITRNGKKPRA